jgi:ERCC4-type nuclease
MTNRFLLSTTETDLAKKLGDDAMLSTIPETKGADILLYTDRGLVGWQRKSIPYDFLSSFTDGRLARAIPLLKERCLFQRIIGEGEFKYYPDTTVNMGRYKGGFPIKTRFNKKHIKGMINDIEFVHGIMIDWTEDLDDTVDYLKSARTFLANPTHMGLFRRPSAKGAWIVPSSKDIYLWVLQSFPGIGPSTADAIVQAFGGNVPMRWTCTASELASVPRISLSKAQELIGYLPSDDSLFIGTVKKTIRVSSVTQLMDSNVIEFSKQFNDMRARLGRK